jgi:hypothetical protein
MKNKFFIFLIITFLFLSLSCNKNTSTNPPANNPSDFPFTVTATINGSQYSAGATMTITEIVTNYMVNITSLGTSGRAIDLTFIFPINSSFPKNLTQSQFNATYSEGSSAIWSTCADSLGSVTAKINSFNFTSSDTVISAEFSFKAWGGVAGGTFTEKNISLGTVTTN